MHIPVKKIIIIRKINRLCIGQRVKRGKNKYPIDAKNPADAIATLPATDLFLLYGIL